MRKIIQYFPMNDLAYGHILNSAFSLIDNGIDENAKNIFDLISYNNILNFFNDRDSFNDEYKQKIDERNSCIKKIKKAISLYAKGFNNEVFLSNLNDFSKENNYYIDEYISFLCKLKLVTKISKDCFNKLIKAAPLYMILEQKDFVSNFDLELKNAFLNDANNLELLISKYDSNNSSKYFFPSLSNDEINLLIEKYLGLEHPNLNTLQLLNLHKDNKDSFKINRKNRVLIKQRLAEENQYIYEHSTSHFESKSGIEMVENQNDPLKLSSINGGYLISVSAHYFFDIKSFQDLYIKLNSICSFIDNQGRYCGLYNPLKESALSEAFYNRHKDEYGSQLFYWMDGMSNMKFNFCYTSYKHHKIYLEELANSLVNDLLCNSLKVKNISLNLILDKNVSYQIKCEHLFNQLNSILKQYRIYVEEGVVNEELLKATTDDLKINDYPSLVGNKYIEINKESKELNNIFYLLFSDQSGLCYIDESRIERDFVTLIRNNNLSINDFPEVYVSKLNYLIDLNIIKSDEYISFVDDDYIVLLTDLHENRFINYHMLGNELKDIINEMIKKKMLIATSNLFSTYESEYLNYYLNNSMFSNSIALRNNYEHGNTPYLTEENHKENYLKGLRILFIIVYKIINDVEISKKISNSLYYGRFSNNE